ncbi:MAG: PAS domain S-box protein, partial [Deltaproteobacteria bacterium]|nr:PAS domain S-box protein [Deltaproteobacteria bacterium]
MSKKPTYEELEQRIEELGQAEFDSKPVKELRVREQQLSLIYDSIEDILYYLKVEPGPHYRFLTVNNAFLKATGLAVEQIIGKTINEIIPKPSLKLVRSNYEKAIRENRVVYWEETSQYPAGLKTGIVSITPIFDDKGTCTHLVGSVHDITEHKHVEEALHKSEKQFSTLIQKIQAAVVVHRADTSIAMSNRSAQVLLGLTENEMLGKTAIDSVWHFFDENENILATENYPVNQVISTQKPLRNFAVGIYRP